MKVSLNISEDQELRAHIKDAIRGQLRSLAREDIGQVIVDVIKPGESREKWFEKIVREEVQKQVAKYVDRCFSSGWSGRDVAREMITNIVLEQFKRLP